MAIKCTNYILLRIYCQSYRTVKTQVEQHHEKYQSPEHRSWHGCYGCRIHDEHQTRSFGGHVLDLPTGYMRHIAQYRKNNETGQKARYRITHNRQICVSKHFHKIKYCIYTH